MVSSQAYSNIVALTNLSIKSRRNLTLLTY